jgi:hypothetical protein
MSYFTGKPTDLFESAIGAYKGGLGSCCAGCAPGKSCATSMGDFSSGSVLGVAVLVGIGWLAIRASTK